ncbi:hypothetical protein [Quadrisphaera sp. KR29]|uniref:hypothetical protein n=1 Tax=Quadrisphaera sp. KR29 TaxID=3461391 RepID=UPI004044E394
MPTPPTPDAARADAVVVLVAPAQARVRALATFALQVRAAAVQGRVVIDDSACRSWSPGQRLVLERLRALADSCARRAVAAAS